MLSSPSFWLWVLWVVFLVISTASKGIRGTASTLLCFLAYLSVSYFTPQLGPWEQYGVYLLVASLVGVSGFVAGTVKVVR
jgi:hypothetical protein